MDIKGPEASLTPDSGPENLGQTSMYVCPIGIVFVRVPVDAYCGDLGLGLSRGLGDMKAGNRHFVHHSSIVKNAWIDIDGVEVE
jgi:hypothetical protein